VFLKLRVSLTSACGNVLSVPTEIERLYREHRAGLVRLVERELHDHHDAEDVVQTAFLDAQRALERGTIPRNPHAWLAAIALNAGRRLRRRRLNAEPLEEYAMQEASGMSEIRAALASLPTEQRAAVVYRDVLGFSYGETAEQMGTSVNAVTMLLYRGRQRLRQTLVIAAGGLGWRWSKQAGMPQVAVVKGAAAVVAAAGVATAGIVVAHVVAPIGTDTTARGSLTPAAVRTPGGRVARESARRHSQLAGSSRVSGAHAATQGAPASVHSSTADAQSLSPSNLRVPTVLVSTPRIPTLPAIVAATVTVTTPIISTTATTPVGLTATTPLTTLTVPVP
jgi:RNA polymerase sigma-70 factor (ECF subfamily)